MGEMRILSGDDVRQALTMSTCIAGMREAFGQLSADQATVPLRTRIPLPAQDGVALFMPAHLHTSDDLAVKIVSVMPRNPAQGEPLIYATVLVLDGTSGRPLALLEGESLTAIRTGAGGGLSAELLSRPESATLAVLGSGVQARAGLEAVCAVRPIQQVRIFSPTRANAEALAHDFADRVAQISAVGSAAEAVRGADIVYCATTSATPVFDDADLEAGAHVIGVGSYTPEMQEIPAETVARALVTVDARASALAEAGDLIQPIAAGLLTAESIHAELGEIVLGEKGGRTSPDQITLFKSVGVAAQDAVAARIALQNAEQFGIGQVVAL